MLWNKINSNNIFDSHTKYDKHLPANQTFYLNFDFILKIMRKWKLHILIQIFVLNFNDSTNWIENQYYEFGIISFENQLKFWHLAQQHIYFSSFKIEISQKFQKMLLIC